MRSVQNVLNRFRTRLGIAPITSHSDQTTLNDAFTGHYARFLRNEYIEQYRTSGAPVLPPVVQQLASRDIVDNAAKQGNPECFTLYTGQGVGMIDDVPDAASIVGAFVQEARATIGAFTRSRSGWRPACEIRCPASLAPLRL